MKKFEYLDYEIIYPTKKNPNPPTRQEQFNKLGDEGWRLITFTSRDGNAIFGRAVIPTDPDQDETVRLS